MIISDAAKCFLEFHRNNSKKNTIKYYTFIISHFERYFSERELGSIKPEDLLQFLTYLTNGNKQNTKNSRYTVIKSFFNFFRETMNLDIRNPCDATILKKTFRSARKASWPILDKDIVDEAIFRTSKTRNRLLLELMARAGMRISEVLKIKPMDIDGRKITLEAPKSGRQQEIVYISQKLSDKIQNHIRSKKIKDNERIFPLSYSGGRKIVAKAGEMVGVKIRPHDLRRFAATYASRSGVPIEIISKVILRHSNLATTELYLGKVTDNEALKWIENLYGY